MMYQKAGRLTALLLALCMLVSMFAAVPTVSAVVAEDNVIFNLDFSNYEGGTAIVDTVSGVTLKADGLEAGTYIDKNGLSKAGAIFTGNKSTNGIMWTSDVLDPMTAASEEKGFSYNTWMAFTKKENNTEFFAFSRNCTSANRNLFMTKIDGNTLNGSICYDLNDNSHKISPKAQNDKVYTKTWYMITVVYNPVDNYLRYYLNGVDITGDTRPTMPASVYSLANNTKDSATAYYSIGGRAIQNDGTRLWDDPVFTGYMASFTMYSTALTQEEITALYTGIETDADAAAVLQEQINALPEASAVTILDEAQIEEARTAYDAATDGVKELVDITRLTAAEAAITAIYENTPIEAIRLIQKIDQTSAARLGSSKTAIEACRAAYDALDAEAQGAIINLDKLEALEASMKEITDAYKASIDAWVAAHASYTKETISSLPWLQSNLISEADMASTVAAMGDEIYYEWMERNLYIGFKGTEALDTYQTLYVEAGTTPNDNLGNPWGQQGRQVAFIQGVFPGIAFSNNYYMPVKNDRNVPMLSNTFTYNGRVYQQFWGAAASYDASVEIVDKSTAVDYRTENIYPGKGAANENSFRYAFAKYNQENKWVGKALGLVDGDAVAMGNYTYQIVRSDAGASLLLNTAERMEAITLAADEAGYMDQLAANAATVITGALAEAFAAADAESIANAGGLVSISDEEIVFENAILTTDGFGTNAADYTAVDAALEKAAALKEADYTAASWAKLQAAIEAVVRDLTAAEQATVDGYAAAIEAAISALVPKTVEMELTISTGMVTAAAAEGKYDITWNARILLGGELSVDDINAAGVQFKNYGVYYGTGKDVLNDYKNATADQIRQVVFDKGEDIDVYTAYGFRLKNVVENRVRAAMFYVEYELNGQSYILLSTVDEAIAIIVG